jgi:hypothetical protein
MTVVVTREGYIARMAAVSQNQWYYSQYRSHLSQLCCPLILTWVLQDQQNKESRELPPLHVYELDPIPENFGGIKPKVDDLSSETNTETKSELSEDDSKEDTDSTAIEDQDEVSTKPSPAPPPCT